MEKPFVIYKGKNQKKPFRVKTRSANGEILNNSQGLTTLQNAFKNIYATDRAVNPALTDEEINCLIHDQTAEDE